MVNGKMVLHMDTLDTLINKVNVINGNIKMAKKLEMFEIKLIS